MKILYLIRHAKSSWKDPTLCDVERPLNKRGKRDAPVMARRLSDEGVRPDIILSSPAKRARETAKIIAEAIDYPTKKIVYSEEIYQEGVEGLFTILRRSNNNLSAIFLLGHNSALTDFANCLIEKPHINLPTCGIAKIALQITSWCEISLQTGTLQFFDFPKNQIV